jgi:hypothetical protein
MRLCFTLLALLAIPVNGFSQNEVDFNRDIRPILSNRCFTCHGPDEAQIQADLRLDSLKGATRDLDGRAAIVPGSPEKSELLKRVTSTDDDERMPPLESGDRLSAKEVDLLRRWIKEGAQFAKHWSYELPLQSALPEVQHKAAVRNAVDRFVLKQLEARRLGPSAEADRYTLIRRLSLDLTGLPPTVERADRFVNDKDPQAYEKLVDELLASDAYGERWATMWLDLARYADSAGYANDPSRTIWLYRDWVIRSLNSNMPFDQFTIQQFAGDLLPKPTQEQLIATAFHRNTLTNSEGGTNDEEFRNAAIIDRVNTSLQVWMGTTIGCAQCHNHKFDPITQEEYFRLFALLNNTEDADRANEAPVLSVMTNEQNEQKAAWQKQIEELEGKLYPTGDALTATVAKWEADAKKPIEWTLLKPTAASSVGTALSVEIGKDGKPVQKESETAVLNLDVKTSLKNITGFRLDAPSNSGGSARLALTGVSVAVIEGEPTAKQGRFVRVTLPGEGKFLHLAEVEVYSGSKNVAPAGKASQSSTDYDGPAKFGNDGNTDGLYTNRSVTHTAQSKDPWWEVDLGSLKPVDRIAVFNRTDGNVAARLDGYVVSVLDEKRNEVWSKKFAKAPAKDEQIAVSGFSPVRLAGLSATSGETSGDSTWTLKAENEKPASAAFALAGPIKSQGEVTLRFRISQNVKQQGALLTPTLQATQHSGKVRVLSDKLTAILATPEKERTASQVVDLTLHVRQGLEPDKAVSGQIAKLKKQMTGLKPTTVPILKELAEGSRRKTFIQIRGNFLVTEKEVSEGVPATFHAFPDGEKLNRLGFAKWLVDSKNPLTARVVVNRYWEQLLGAGLVKTSEEFGNQGELPSHPQLLDWLAVEFAKTWDVKALVKTIVMSGTYRQSSRVTKELAEADPYNRLLSRGPRVRLTAEMIRDQALAAAGLLSRKMYGPPVRPPRPNLGLKAAFGSSTDWTTSMGEDRYRRGLYTQWRRSLPYPSMTTFDAPNRNVCTIRRAPTNTPLQALVTLNDPVYVEAAQSLARRIVKDGGDTTASRLTHGFRLCLTRLPSERELARLVQLFEEARSDYADQPEEAKLLATDPLGPVPEGADPVDLAAWTLVGNVLLNLDETLARR